MNANDARELLSHGSRVTRVGWPNFLYLDPGDTIPPEDESASDFVELTEEDWQEIQNEANGVPKQEQVLQQPVMPEAQAVMPEAQTIEQPTTTIKPIEGLKIMPVLQVKKTKPVNLRGLWAGHDAEIVAVNEITCSDPTSALPLAGDTPEILGLKPAQGLTIKAICVIRDSNGQGRKVEGVSNPFDVVAGDVELVPALDANGQPLPETTDSGEIVLDEATGAPKIKMIPATAALEVTVQG